jgi:hypothetical protein
LLSILDTRRTSFPRLAANKRNNNKNLSQKNPLFRLAITPNLCTMTTLSSASPAGARPYNAALLTVFVLLSVAGAWFMRISLVLYDAPVDLLGTYEVGKHPNGTPIRKDYTGLKHLDEGVSFLVTVFLPGSAGWNETFYWQQFHFLLQLTGLVAIMNVEACRERNRASWLK